MKQVLVALICLAGLAAPAEAQRRQSLTADQKVEIVRCIYQQMFVQKAAGNAKFDTATAAANCGAGPSLFQNRETNFLGSSPPPQKRSVPAERRPAAKKAEQQLAEEKVRFATDELQRAAALYEEVAHQDAPARPQNQR